MTMTAPAATDCQKNSILKMIVALVIMAKRMTPHSAPSIEALPPNNEVPPTTTAAMTCRFRKLAEVAWIELSLPASITPASPASAPINE